MAFNPNELLYKLQFQRGLSPAYIFVTKQGFGLSIFVIYMIFTGQTTLTWTLIYAIGFWAVYKIYFPYKYTEVERVWLISLWNEFTTQRIEQPIKVRPIIDWKETYKVVKKKNEKPSEIDLYVLEEKGIKVV